MNFDYDEMLRELDKRRFNADDMQKILNDSYSLRHYAAATESLNESTQYRFLKENSLIQYIIGAMSPVSKNYTQQIVSDRTGVENVLKQLNDNIYKNAPLEFRYQGSVSNNTHIRKNSDVDLLTIIGKFETLERPQVPACPYEGIPTDDLRELRQNCINQIKKVIPSVNINSQGAKSIALTGGSLIVKVDVVPANWFNSNLYASTKNETYRGIQVYNSKTNERVLNYPFWFNNLLAEKDNETKGVYKNAVRLLKNIKADTECKIGIKVQLSSYAISSLLYSVSNFKYYTGKSPLTLLKVLNETLSSYSNEFIFKNLKDPLGEPLNSSESVEGVRVLQSATQTMLNDLGAEINKEISLIS